MDQLDTIATDDTTTDTEFPIIDRLDEMITARYDLGEDIETTADKPVTGGDKNVKRPASSTLSSQLD